ncbi:coxsackievirus and adenovirus receptor homolog [Micropterus salmoides]|uniref:coxsackievirus and adenovirus receptor homolog n=1 Tax=Micropterus salmoides TaxID=27706 RepID=UPI0018EAD7B8|nr:coxsackievirus and adenovirus receptor homolog [Micropterus salmoides]
MSDSLTSWHSTVDFQMGGSTVNKNYTAERRSQSDLSFISSTVMAAFTFAPFVALFTCSWIFVLCQETPELKVKPGEDATLQCQGHRDADIEVIKWIRPDLKSDDGYVFFFREERSYENYQHESYRGRVELQDPEMKDGDASVILQNVNINDAGTYECRVREEKETGQAKPISIIRLKVTEPGHTAGHKEGGDKEGGDKEGGDKEGGKTEEGDKDVGDKYKNIEL